MDDSEMIDVGYVRFNGKTMCLPIEEWKQYVLSDEEIGSATLWTAQITRDQFEKMGEFDGF